MEWTVFLGILFIVWLGFCIYDHITKKKKKGRPREGVRRHQWYRKKGVYVIPDFDSVFHREKAAPVEQDVDFQTLHGEFQRQYSTLPELQTPDAEKIAPDAEKIAPDAEKIAPDGEKAAPDEQDVDFQTLHDEFQRQYSTLPELQTPDGEKAAPDEQDVDFQTLHDEFQRQCSTLPELQTTDELINKIKAKDLISRFVADGMHELEDAPNKLGALYMLGRLIQESMTTDEDRVDAFKYYLRAYDQNEEYNQDLDLAQDIYPRSKDIEPVRALDLLDRKDGMFDDPVLYDLMYKEFKEVLPTEERTTIIGQLLCYSTYSNMSKKICSEANMSLLKKMVSE